MTSRFKVPTENIPQSSSGAGTEVKVLPSAQSQNLDNTLVSIPTLKNPSNSMLSTVKSVLEISEKSRQHAFLTKVLLSRLEKAGLIKRFKVLSPDGKTWKETQIVFDNIYWDENLDLKVLSSRTTVNLPIEAK